MPALPTVAGSDGPAARHGSAGGLHQGETAAPCGRCQGIGTHHLGSGEQLHQIFLPANRLIFGQFAKP